MPKRDFTLTGGWKNKRWANLLAEAGFHAKVPHNQRAAGDVTRHFTMTSTLVLIDAIKEGGVTPHPNLRARTTSSRTKDVPPDGQRPGGRCLRAACTFRI